MAKVIKNPKIEGIKIETYEVNDSNGNTYEFSIMQPDFEKMSYAMRKLIKIDGTVDVTGAGKALWDTCVTEYDKEIEENPALLVSVSLKLADIYLKDLEADIKKK